MDLNVNKSSPGKIPSMLPFIPAEFHQILFRGSRGGLCFAIHIDHELTT